jgi:hypothetical protein
MLIRDYIVGMVQKTVPIEISGAIYALAAVLILNKSISKESYIEACNKQIYI